MNTFKIFLFALLLPIMASCIFEDDDSDTAPSVSFSITSFEENARITAANSHIFPVRGTCKHSGQTLLFQANSQNLGSTQCQSDNTYALDLDFTPITNGPISLEIVEDAMDGETIDISLEKEVLPYISRWTTVGNNEVVSLYLNSTGTYNFWADYGDGTPRVHITSHTDSDAEHTYATPGTHTITITGLCTGMDGSDVYGLSQASGRTYQNQLIEVVDLGNVGWRTFSGLFYRAGNLTDVSGGDTSRVTNMGNMFAWATNATPDTSGWIVDNVTQMGTMFLEARSADPDVSGWNVSNVTDMSGMFWTALAANPDVSAWDVSSVTSMLRMFSETTTADPDVSGWDVSNVTDMTSMFHDATMANPDVSAWDVNSVTNMRWIFYNASAADPDMGNWNWNDSSSIQSNDFLRNSNIGQANYTALLIRLASENPDFTSKAIETTATYDTTAQASRDMLTGSLGWTITDGGVAP